MDERDAVPSPDPASDLKLRQSQEVTLLQTALAGLPLESREVLVLSRFQNLKYEQIARILDCGVGAVGTINGGGPEIRFKTLNGNIRIRKGKG